MRHLNQITPHLSHEYQIKLVSGHKHIERKINNVIIDKELIFSNNISQKN